jgi:CRP-like cAMP-binding protein
MTSPIEFKNELYDGFSDAVCRELSVHEQTRTFAPGTRLVESGVPSEQLIILISGTAETTVEVSGKTVSLGIAGPGKVFVLHSIIAGAMPEATVTCLQECMVTLVPKAAFLHVLERNPQMYFAVVKVLSSDLAAAHRVLRNYARRSAGYTRSKTFPLA